MTSVHFDRWLRKQRRRRDSVGDLARRVLDDDQFPKRPRGKPADYARMHGYLTLLPGSGKIAWIGVEEIARYNLERAWAEFVLVPGAVTGMGAQ